MNYVISGQYLVVLQALLLSGCISQCDPVWTSDSKSFIVSKADGSVIQYDVEQRATRQLLSPGM